MSSHTKVKRFLIRTIYDLEVGPVGKTLDFLLNNLASSPASESFLSSFTSITAGNECFQLSISQVTKTFCAARFSDFFRNVSIFSQ